MIGKVTYHQQVSYCGKPRCKKCREGTGHGPYWYAYQTVDGRTSRTYVGKTLPQEALETIEGSQPSLPVHRSEQEQEKATIRIYTLGQFRLERRSSPSDPEWHTVTESAWQHQRVRALLGCLLTHPGRKLGREQIMEYLWPDLDFEMAASRLDRSVYSLRQLFEPTRSKIATSPLLLTEREILVLADQTQVWVDADAFEHLLTQAHDSNDPGEKEKLLEEAMLLYGAEFLPEAKKIDWTSSRRESLLRSWIGLLLELSDLRSERESYSASIEPLDKLLSVDPANEAAVQRLMLRLGILGRRGEALQAYRQLLKVLQQEYNITPLPDTRAIYEKVRGGQSSDDNGSQAAKKVSLQPASQAAPRTDAPATIQIGRSHQSPLVGRQQELSLLRDLVTTTEQAAKFKLPGAKKTSMLALDTQRRPQCILLMGEVGIGKTRLAEEVSRDAKKRNWAVAWSRVYSQEGSIPYRLWTEVLRKAMEQGAWQRQEVSKRSLVFQPLTALLPDVLQPLLVPIAFSSALPPEQEQLRLWEAACELLKLISESTPLLIALDDLQWADASSCELLAYLSRRLQGYPIVIVGTCRENELAASHPLRSLLTDLQREHSVECVSLEPLSDEQIDALVSSIQVPQPLVKRIRSRAAGNPFFAEELARTIPLPGDPSQNNTGYPSNASSGPSQSNGTGYGSGNSQTNSGGYGSGDSSQTNGGGYGSGNSQTNSGGYGSGDSSQTNGTGYGSGNSSQTNGGGYGSGDPSQTNGGGYGSGDLTVGTQFIASGDSSNYQLPETISAVLELRLSRLTAPCQRLLSKAAILGGSFEFNVISAMEATVPGYDEDVVLDLLEEALKSGMLTEQGTGTRIMYEFWHPLLVTHLYEKLSAARRASLHRRAAEILLRTSKGREEEEAATITYHLVGGGADEAVVAKYAEIAANHANLLSAYPDAEYHYHIAIDNLGKSSDDRLHLAYLLECLGECVRIQGKYEEARGFFEKALDTRTQHFKFAHVNIPQREAQIQAMLCCQIGWTWYDTVNNAKAREYYMRAEQILKDTDVLLGTVWATIRLRQGYVSWAEGNYEEAHRMAQEALILFEEALGRQKQSVEDVFRLTHIRRTLIGDPVDLGRAHLLLGLIANGAGQPADVLMHYSTALALYEQYDSLRDIAIACCDLGSDVYLRRADHTPAQAILRRSLSIAERIGDIPVTYYTLGNLGILDARTGNLVEAEGELRQSIALAERVDDQAAVSIWHTYLAFVLKEQGKLSEAERTIYRALTISRNMHITPFIGSALVTLGRIRLAQAIIFDEKNPSSPSEDGLRVLRRAKNTLHRVLSLEAIEAETRTEGQLTLAQVSLLLGDVKDARQQTEQALEEARHSELVWLIGCAQQLSGYIESRQNSPELASQHFELASRIFRKSDMRLEYARTLHLYGAMLVEQDSVGGKRYLQGRSYLQDALKVFVECKAELDRAMVERCLVEHNFTAAK